MVAVVGVLGVVALAPRMAFALDEAGGAGGSASGVFADALARGPVFAIFAAFVGGLLVSLTPCVYPMIAITVSVFGANQAKSRREAAGLSSVFVLGIAVMFTALGVGAALSGAIFGRFLSNPYVVGGLAIVFLGMAASMFGAFEMALPSSLTNRLATVGGIGIRGAFVLGLVSALVAAPCTGPVLTGILVWIATSHRLVLGTGVMFSFALGLGAPFFLVGTFAVSLPKSGSWMLGVKWLFGVVLSVVALYFLRNVVGALQHVARPTPAFASVSAALLGVAVVLAWMHVASERKGAKHPERSKTYKLVSIPLVDSGARGRAAVAHVRGRRCKTRLGGAPPAHRRFRSRVVRRLQRTHESHLRRRKGALGSRALRRRARRRDRRGRSASERNQRQVPGRRLAHRGRDGQPRARARALQ
jgi:thiol:disulfide interchange protein DsbD